MRDFVLTQAEAIERSRPFPTLSRLISNLLKRRRLHRIADFDDHILRDIGLTRGELAYALGQPLDIDPVWELERQAILRRGDYGR